MSTELFSTIAELKKYVSVNSDIELESIEGKVFDAARKYITDWLGSVTYNNLVTAYAAASLTTEQAALLPYVQRALANFSLFEYTAVGSIQFQETGIMRIETENDKTAYKYQINELKKSLIETGFDSLELMLEFLEENEGDYSDWVSSDGYTMNKEFFINSSKDFKKAYYIFKGRYTFDILRNLMDDLECFSILPCIGQPYFDELKSEILAKSVTTENKIALKIIQKAVAHFTINEGVKRDWVVLTPEGVQVRSLLGDQSLLSKPNASTNPVHKKLEQSSEMGNRHLSKLKELLVGNTDYPTFNTWRNEQIALEEAAEEEEIRDCDDPNKNNIGIIAL